MEVSAGNNAARERGLNPGWKPGQSGNPSGRPKQIIDIGMLARQHGSRCIAVIAAMLDDEDARIRLAAASTLLERGFGKAVQTVVATGTDNAAMHLLAAQIVSQHLADTRQAPPPATQIEGVPVTGSLLDAPQPTE